MWSALGWILLAAQEPPLDVLITGGRVLDGTGNPGIYADAGIRGGLIAAVGRLAGVPSRRAIDAKGKFVTPGELAGKVLERHAR